jgi:hypothetical protein
MYSKCKGFACPTVVILQNPIPMALSTHRRIPRTPAVRSSGKPSRIKASLFPPTPLCVKRFLATIAQCDSQCFAATGSSISGANICSPLCLQTPRTAAVATSHRNSPLPMQPSMRPRRYLLLPPPWLCKPPPASGASASKKVGMNAMRLPRPA